MNKIDLRKELKHLYAPPPRKIAVVNVPRFNFIMLDGETAPGESPESSTEFHDALMALYGLSFTLKFMSKLRKTNPIDYTLMALEGLWWVDSGQFDFSRKEPWRFTLMMMQPRHITQAMFREAGQQMRAKRDNPALAKVRRAGFKEGLCLQALHVGPYSAEPQTIAKMRAFADENGYVYCGKHHEIYLGDPRRAKPEKLKTILRQPIAKRRADLK
jgi:hypothetical protein